VSNLLHRLLLDGHFDETNRFSFFWQLGYIIYRRVLRYYSGEEDGLDMRKALSRDVEKKSVIPLKRPITPDELEYD
jgi:N-terminal acetyltransferase B complex catalytic subunit